MKNNLQPTIALAVALTVASAATAAESVEMRLWEGVDGVTSPGEPNHEQRGDATRSNRWTTGVTDPVITIYRPDEARATGAACVVFPGGGYSGVALDKEGHFIAEWLSDRGILGVVVPYRCGRSNGAPTPQADAARAVRVVRSRAEEWNVDPEQVGVMGFSAGGHLAAITATLAGETAPPEPLSDVSARPDFAVLVYPVISMREGVGHAGSRRNLLGEDPDESDIAKMSADEQVTADTPPTILFHSADDRVVKLVNPMRFYAACKDHGVPAELKVYPLGGHGYGMWMEEGEHTAWPSHLEEWLVGRGLARR